MAEEDKDTNEDAEAGTATETATEDWLSSEIEEVSPCKKLIKVSIAPSYISGKSEEAYDELKKNADIHGFRKGKAPLKLLQRKFGKDVDDQVQDDVVAEAYQQVLDDNGLIPVGEPEVDKKETAEDKTLTFEVTVEVRPEFELGQYEGLKLEKESEEVTDEDMDKAIENLQKQRAELVTEEGRKAKEGDVVLGEMKITVGDEILNEDKETMIPLQKGRLLGVDIDFAKIMKNAKAGDEKSTTIKLPDDYEKEELQGKDAEIKINVKEVKVQNLPEVNEEFAKLLGFPDIEGMKGAVKRHAEASKKAESRENLESQIFDKLLAEAKFEIPEGLLDRESDRMKDDMRRRMYHRGVPPKVIDERLAEMDDSAKDESSKRIKAGFILDKIADKEKVVATEDEVQNMIDAMAADYRQKPEDVKKRIEKAGTMGNLRGQIKREKVVQLILDKSDVSDKKGKKK